MSVARRLAAAFAVVGIGVLAYAVPASATESGEACIANPTPDQLVGTLDVQHGTATVRAHRGLEICGDVYLSVYTVPETWVGPQFDSTAVPQTIFGESDHVKVKGSETYGLKVAMPHCGPVQIDLYTAPEITEVATITGHSGHFIKGSIFWYLDSAGKPLTCEKPTPTPSETTPSPSPSQTTPSPSPSQTTPSPSPSETTPSTTPSETGSSSAPETTTPAAVIPPTGGTPGPVTEVPTVPTSNTTPVLASTGSNATIPLIGFGAVLVVAGIGLSLLGRRRRTA
jgi:LPXTG-motif cell wall-anchored protein